MAKHQVSAEQKSAYADRENELYRRFKGGSLDPQAVLDGLQRLLEGAGAKWHEKDGIIYLTVISDGTSGPRWIARLEAGGFRVSDWARQILRSPDFRPTTGVTYRVAVLKGSLFADSGRTTASIRAVAAGRGLATPNAEVACLIREALSDSDLKAMGLTWYVTMHKPIADSDHVPDLLAAGRYDGGRWLNASYGRPDGRWDRDGGFVFVLGQASSALRP